MRLLYLYPEEWTGRRAREVHTYATCQALAQEGIEVTLVTAGGLFPSPVESRPSRLHCVNLSRHLGPVKSATIFKHRFHQWRKKQARFDWAYIIHLKAADMLRHEHVMPYAYEAHEIFSQTPQRTAAKQTRLHELERQVIAGATRRIATSSALASALSTWFALPSDFEIVPNAGSGDSPSVEGAPDGPFVYSGSIADWKGLDLIIHAARDAAVPLKIIGGTQEEWTNLGRQVDTHGIDWLPRVPLAGLPRALAGARAGLIPTQPETPSGRYSCPMKLFDYAGCGLPVVSSNLPSLASLAIGSWCVQVPTATRTPWAKALRDYRYAPEAAEAARRWANDHTWTQRARRLGEILGRGMAG